MLNNRLLQAEGHELKKKMQLYMNFGIFQVNHQPKHSFPPSKTHTTQSLKRN